MNNPDDSSLYRREALTYAGQDSFGNVLITQPLSLRIMTLIIIFIVLTIMIFLHYGEYARKVTVNGYLEPDGGITRVHPIRGGVVEELFFDDGEFVETGQPLLRVKVPFLLASGKEAHQEILAELFLQKNELVTAVGRTRNKHELDKNWHEAKFASLKKEREQIIKVQELQRSQSAITEKQLRALQNLKNRNFVSDFQLLEVEGNYLQDKRDKMQLSQKLTQITTQIAGSEHQSAVLPAAFEENIQSLKLRLSRLNQSITEAMGRSEYLINAPTSGRITAVNVKIGDSITTGESIFAIIPHDALLYARLLIPSRAAGFIDDGQSVRLMYDSFPFQQFGTQAGSIVSITNAVINPQDLKGPSTVNEPVFMAKVRLQKSSITAFGKEQALQADMLLTADIVQEKRSILDWILEPLYALRGRT